MTCGHTYTGPTGITWLCIALTANHPTANGELSHHHINQETSS